MPIYAGSSAIGGVYHGSQAIKEVYQGSELVWTSAPTTAQLDYNWESARTAPFRVMFLGSSTTQGYGVVHPEQFSTQMTAHVVSNVLGVGATPMIKKTTGTQTAPTENGFHFLNAGVGGTTSQTYWANGQKDLTASFLPRVAVHMIGSNDYSQGMSPATFKANVQRAISEVNNRSSGCKHILIQSFKRLDVTNPAHAWEDYGKALLEIAKERTDADYCDLPRILGERWLGEGALLGDNVHANWFGNTLLARGVAEFLGLMSHEGEVIYDWDVLGVTLSNNVALSSKTPTVKSLIPAPLTSSGNNRPLIRVRDGVRSVDYYNGAKKMVADWGGAYAAPMTMILVARMWNDNFGTNVKPLFTRATASDDGYMWAWRNTSGNTVHAAINSPSGTGVPVARSVVDNPSVFAVTFRENGWVTFYPGTTVGTDVSPVGTDTTNGPWMKSLKMMTNTRENNWGEADMYAVRFIKGAGPEVVAQHMRELGALHNIPVDGVVPDGPAFITGTSGTTSQTQFRNALTAKGTSYDTVTALPFEVDTSRATNVSSLFYGCQALTSAPTLDLSNVTSVDSMFQQCQALTSVPAMYLPKVTDLDYMFRFDAAITSVELSGLSGVALARSAFAGCTSLTSLTVDDLGPSFQQQDLPGSPQVGQTLDLRNTALTPAAANRLMSGLGGNEFSAKLLLPATAAGCDTSVAVAKGWTV